MEGSFKLLCCWVYWAGRVMWESEMECIHQHWSIDICGEGAIKTKGVKSVKSVPFIDMKVH